MRFLIFLFLWAGILVAQSPRIVKFNEVERLFRSSSKKTYVLNFWATWCSPCVEELPHFERLQNENPDLAVILISLDFKSQLESKVLPFLKKNQIRSQVWLLDETDANSYIDKVSPDWSGAIPATLILDRRTNQRLFFEKEFNYQELLTAVQPFLQ